jgi:hypothetical protein
MTKSLFCSLLFALVCLMIPSAGAQGPPWRHSVASTRTLHIGGAAIQVDFGPGQTDLSEGQIVEWVKRAAEAVSVYYGRFPVAQDRVLVEFAPGERGIGHGTTWGGVGGVQAFTRIQLGQHTTQQDLDDDWMMTHELVHTAFPSVSDEHHWIEEGLATYIEPVARVQAGFLPAESIWSDMVRDMPKGNPEAFDRGLDRTHTWGRTYWGGALFCLQADVSIRKETHNQKGLIDALRAIVAAGGTIDQDWPLGRALEAGDRATGTHVLTDLYRQMGDTPMPVNLAALWKELGVESTPSSVRFNGQAPEAAIREAITRKN